MLQLWTCGHRPLTRKMQLHKQITDTYVFSLAIETESYNLKCQQRTCRRPQVGYIRQKTPQTYLHSYSVVL